MAVFKRLSATILVNSGIHGRVKRLTNIAWKARYVQRCYDDSAPGPILTGRSTVLRLTSKE